MSVKINDDVNTKQLEDGTIELVDFNNKVLKVQLNDIVDASTNMADTIVEDIKDNVGIDYKYSLVITDENGNAMDEGSLIKDVKSGDVSALDVTFEATHSGRNKNNVVYSSDSMEKDSKSWLYPFAKPLIKNHDMHEEPIGRVVDSSFGESEITDNRDTINVTFRVYDEDAMKKFADGRYKTMSIGASSNHITCNVCGKDILKDNSFKFCGHWKGESYKGQVATWTTKDVEYREGSVVNNPADIYAQVKKIRAIKQKDGKDMADKNESMNNDAISDIDNLINSTKQNTQINDQDNTELSEGEVTQVSDTETTEKSVDEKLNDALNKISELESKINSLSEENKDLKDKVVEKDSEIKTLSDSNTSSTSRVNEVIEQAKRLAIFNKQLLVDNLKSLNTDLTDEELENKTAKEISDMIKTFKINTKREPSPILKNPGIAINDSNTIVAKKNEEQLKSVKTMKDMEEVVLNFFK